jgi:hypothetical protein
MTPLVHGRRTLRRLPPGGVLGRRFSVWDAMGYHGITWASINGPLTGRRLKEWLKWAQLAAGAPSPRPHEAVARAAPRRGRTGPRRSANAGAIADAPVPRNLSLQARRHLARLTADSQNGTRKFTNLKLKARRPNIGLPAVERAALCKFGCPRFSRSSTSRGTRTQLASCLR